MGKTSVEVKNRYNAKTYDFVRICVKKADDTKNRWQQAADNAGLSLTAYIAQAVEERIRLDESQGNNAAQANE